MYLLISNLFYSCFVKWCIKAEEMDCSKRKLRSGKETSEEWPDNKDKPDLPDSTGAVNDDECEGTVSQCEHANKVSIASSDENNGRACNECNFVAKTPTALKIHCRKKHSSLHAEAENDADEMPPTEQPKSTDQLSTDEPSIDTFSTDAPPIEQLISTAPPIDQLSTGAQRFERLYCRCCSFYTSTAEEMNAHLSDESHQNLAMEKNISPLIEQCVEKVLVILSDKQKQRDEPNERDEVISEDVGEDVRETESAEHALAELVESSASHKRKRGRPKSSQVMSCSHCGLVASNPTNLSVHIRRKHSRLYSFHCKLCNYSCVTKGDMDRHCETKKHIKRVQSEGDGQEAVIILNAEQAAQLCDEAESGEKIHNVPNAAQQETPNVKEDGETEGIGSDVPCKKPKYDSVYSCDHCNFVAHSALSLALHVRRKHTRDFEFVCLACSYYAVTRREMSRHTATEKHKLKCQRYLQKRHNTHQSDKNVDKHNENTSQLAENVNQQSNSTDKNIEYTHQNTDNSHQHTEPNPQLCINKQQNTKILRQNTDPEASSGSNDGLNNGAGEEATNVNPQMKSSEDTNGSKDSLEFPDPSNTEDGEEEYNNGDGDDDEEEVEGENVCETTAQSPSSERHVFRAAPFDECVFSLKATTDRPLSEDNGESYTSLHQAAKMLKMSEGDEISTRVRCDDCGFLAEGLSGLNVHITMKHSSKEKNFHCLLCGKSFHSDNSLQQHLSSSAHLRTERGSVDERPDGGAAFRCVRCNDPCNSEQELFVHIKEKHEELLHEVNKYVMEDTEQINREREENPGNVCKYCGKVCKSSNSMAFLAHVRTHTGTHSVSFYVKNNP